VKDRIQPHFFAPFAAFAFLVVAGSRYRFSRETPLERSILMTSPVPAHVPQFEM
jgi:hypothetical protein